MKQNIFYVHTPKCGGTSVSNALQSSKVNFIPTSAININDINNEAYNLVIDPTSKNWIVFGHSFHLITPLTKGALERQKKLLEILFFNTQIILPTRHPVDLLRSWMHYYKTRVNNFISDNCTSSNLEAINTLNPTSKMGRFYSIISQLCPNQDPIKGFILDVKYEQDNLFGFFSLILKDENLVPAWNHTLSLLYPYRFQILEELRINKPITVDIDQFIESTKPFIYDSQNISSLTREYLSSTISEQFYADLIKTKQNVSQGKRALKVTDLKSFNQFYNSRFNCEFKIYQYSH